MSQILLVTGGSRGIGAAVCRRAAKEGYSVAVNFHRDLISANNVVDDITSDGGIAILGQTKSFGEGDYDLYLIKTNSIGNSILCSQNSAATLVTTPATSVNTFTFSPVTPGCIVSATDNDDYTCYNVLEGEINCPTSQTYFQKMYGGTGHDIAYSV